MSIHPSRQALSLVPLFVVLALLVLCLSACEPALKYPDEKTAGTATPINNTSSASIVGSPSISASFINQVLIAYHSPAAGKGQALYDLGVQYHIDPAWALAFFMHESLFGTKGEATFTRSLGNLRCIPNYPCPHGYAQFPSWEEGFKAWFVLLSGPLYIGAGRTAVEDIVHRYAPAADNNNELAYCAALSAAVQEWRAGHVTV